MLFATLLTSQAARYGYHRDEFYFLAAGRHLDWAYPDQPLLIPLIARAMSAIDADSLLLLRVPAILAATLVVVCAGLMARELGGGRGAQALAAGAVASAAVVMGAGHILSTAVFDLAVWSVLVVLVLKLLNDPGPEASDAGRRWVNGLGRARWWLAIGVVVGIGLENKLLLIFPVAALLIALALVGPRNIFATKYFPISAGIAVVLWLPYLWWQARNGWPQWEVSREIAGGSSGTSDSQIEFVLSQFGLMGPLLVPLWVYGWWRLWREKRQRAFAVSYVLLFVLFAATGGKAYYLGGMYPIPLAAAAVPVAAWVGRRRIPAVAIGALVTVNAVLCALLFLPVLPVETLRDSPVLAVNYDAGETVGWPEFVRQIADVRRDLGPDVAIFTDNYGEAGAIEHYGTRYDLPTPHSGHNSYWWWGPPEEAVGTVIVVGIRKDRMARFCGEITEAGRIDNGLDIDNEEQGAPILICRQPRLAQLWAETKHLG